MSNLEYTTHAVSKDMLQYGVGHDPRYQYLEKLIRQLPLASGAKALDIGPGFFTLRLAEIFTEVSSLGLPEARNLICEMPDSIRHFAFDLNDARDPSLWVSLPKFDLIVFAEVIEHLPTAPQQVLRYLATALSDTGYLIIQTPNAVSLDKRIKMVLGLHPFEMIRENWRNPGHFREYTKVELHGLAKECGFEVVKHEFRSYFRSSKVVMKMIDRIVTFFPFLRRGQTIVLRLKRDTKSR